jgi:hypothetical protein
MCDFCQNIATEIGHFRYVNIVKVTAGHWQQWAAMPTVAVSTV